MRKKEFIHYFGGKYATKKAAEYLGLHPQTLYTWGDIVPEKWAYKIHYELGIELKKDDYETST